MLLNHFLHSPGTAAPLRIGVLLDHSPGEAPDSLPKPFASVLEHIDRCNFAKLAVRIYNTAPSGGPQPSPIGKSVAQRLLGVLKNGNRRQHLLWSLYEKLDARNSVAETARLGSADIDELLRNVPRIDVTPIGKGFIHRFPEDAVAAVREHDLDVVIRFGFNILRGEILKVPRYGIWSYHHGDNDYYRGGPAHFWELVEKNPQSGVMLQVLTEKLDDGLVLCKGTAPTEDTILLSKNRIAPYLLGETFIIRKLRELHLSSWDEVQTRALPQTPYLGSRKIYRTPGNIQMAAFLLPPMIRKALGRGFRRPTVQHWRLALRVGGERLDATKPSASCLDGFRWIDCPRGHFWADPFLAQRDEKVFCFFEDYDYRTGMARISCGEVTQDAGLADIRPVLAPSYHLSYPFVFEDGGETFMIPESAKGGGVDLYRARQFPWEWEHVARILDAPCLDTTIVRRDGIYWLFTTFREPAGSANQLALMYARTLTGPYKFHPVTPLNSDARFARCGGRIIESEDGLVRPSQDACNGYGSALHFRRIAKISTSEYEEEHTGTLGPMKGFRGLHHYDRAGSVEVIDGWNLAASKSVEALPDGAAIAQPKAKAAAAR